MKWWDQIAMNLVFWMLSFKPTFSLSSFTLIKRLFNSSSLSHKGGVICISEVIDISLSNFDSSLCFFQGLFFHYAEIMWSSTYWKTLDIVSAKLRGSRLNWTAFWLGKTDFPRGVLFCFTLALCIWRNTCSCANVSILGYISQRVSLKTDRKKNSDL